MNNKIGIIGLGYVGLPLARVFSKKYSTIGFDIDGGRINELRNLHDRTNELTTEELSEVLVSNSKPLALTSQEADLKDCDYFIITVPTPVDANHKPDLSSLISASKTVAGVMKKGSTIVYESTVFPGATEEVCVPVLEAVSGYTYNSDFYVGYSPERINPSDKLHTVDKILKVTSGSTPAVAQKIDQLYGSVITAGTYLAPSIKVAEAAKVIENSQRDINIAFVNELAKIFNLLQIDTNEILKAASTKWNFLPFKPGLVGGHCIGVDPYYLAQKAVEVGYHPEIILAGRRLNDSMGKYISSEVVKLMLKKGIVLQNSKVLILGLTFKENCPDVRNTRVIDIINDLKEYGVTVEVLDPVANKALVKKQLDIDIHHAKPSSEYDGIILAVAHKEFERINLAPLKKNVCAIYDVKGLSGIKSDKRL